MTTFVLNLNHHPHERESAAAALQFARALTQSSHQLLQVFFYQDAVLYPFHESAKPWRELAQQHQITLVVCHTQLEQRSVAAQNIDSAFTLSGLTEFATTVACADRLVSF